MHDNKGNVFVVGLVHDNKGNVFVVGLVHDNKGNVFSSKVWCMITRAMCLL